MSIVQALAGLAVLSLASETTPPSQLSQSPAPAATVTVRLLAGKTTYHIGEEIPLQLEFRGRADESYYFSTETSDRSGRLPTEQYDVSPADAVGDPLKDLFGGSVFGGGFSSMHPLNDTPWVLTISLNDWVRFNRPGAYRLVVTSRRLHRYSNAPVAPLISAPIDFTIVAADEGWQAAELARATQLLDQKDAPSLQRGATLLRYLDTDAAARTLVARYDDIARTQQFYAVAGVLASSRRATIVRAMEARIDAGEPLEGSFITTAARVRVLTELPAPTSAAEYQHVTARRDAIVAEYERRWRAARTNEPVTVASLSAELDRLRNVASAEIQQETAARVARHPTEARQAFLALPAAAQAYLIRNRWDALNSAWFLPVLREAYDGAIGQQFGSTLADAALTRIRELQPDEGRRLLIEEIRTGDHGVTYAVLSTLPDTTLPELDEALQARLRSGAADPRRSTMHREMTDWLIARYGSRAFLPAVAASIRNDACQRAAAHLAYLSKHDRAAAARQLQACDVVPFPMLESRYWDERIEAEAIARLRRPEADQSSTAASALGRRGSAATKAALVERLTRWHAEWSSRAAELAAGPWTMTTNPQRIESSIVSALFQNPLFLLTTADVAAIRALCITDGCRQMVDMRARTR